MFEKIHPQWASNELEGAANFFKMYLSFAQNDVY